LGERHRQARGDRNRAASALLADIGPEFPAILSLRRPTRLPDRKDVDPAPDPAFLLGRRRKRHHAHRREPSPRKAVLSLAPLCRECGGYNTSREERSSRLPVRRFRLPAPALFAGLRPEKPITGTEMKNSPYLDKPFVPLALALRSMLAETEAKIAAAGPAEKARLQERADVLREWLTLKSAARSQPSCVSGQIVGPVPAQG
jgi:hypothetical protein